MIYVVANSIGTFGGGAFVAMDLLDSLISSEKKAGVISVNYQIPERTVEKFKDVKRIRMPYIPQKNNYSGVRLGSIRYALKHIQYSLDHFKLKHQIHKYPPSLMIFNDSADNTRNFQNTFDHLCNTVQIIHISPNFEIEFGLEDSINEYIEAYNRSDALVFVSEECRKKWVSYNKLDNKKTYYIPNCANEDVAGECLKKTKRHVRNNLDLDPDTFYLISVASLQPRKGQDLLIKAAPHLKKIAPNLEILFIGGLKEGFGLNLKKQVEQEGLDYVKFLGRKENAMEYIYASDSFILTSKAEAFPLVILEAMILKTPVIASNVDGVPEMIEDRVNGYLFERENIDDLVTCFEEMYQNKSSRKTYLKNASDKYWDNFTKAQFTKRYLDMIDELTS